MADKVHKIHSLPQDAPWKDGLPPVGSDEHPLAIRALDRVLYLQRPVVLAHLRSITLRNPHATGDEIVAMLGRRYLATVTSGGAAVGATAVVPGVGTGITLALSGAETIGFLESTALFAQSVTEVHGISITDPDRARALVLTLMLGSEGTKLLGQLVKQFNGNSAPRSQFWGELITSSLPKAAMGPIVDRLKSAFLHQLATRGSASVIGKAMPFGVGAAIGAGGNLLLGRRVVTGSRRAFGPAPKELPADILPRPGAKRIESRAAAIAARAGSSAKRVASTTKDLTQSGAKAVSERIRGRKSQRIEEDPLERKQES